jgi:hypothetical protein
MRASDTGLTDPKRLQWLTSVGGNDLVVNPRSRPGSVGTGEVLSEDDIERLGDRYGRT